MDHLWIMIAMFAALMQAVRTAAQKTLNQRMSTLATTYVRSLFGLPIMLAYLAGVLFVMGGGVPRWNWPFLLNAFLGALSQVLATMLLIYLFRLRNFAVGTVLTKFDIVITALLGALFFSETLSALGILALLVVLLGVLLMSVGRLGLAVLGSGGGLIAELAAWPTQVALLCALMFTFSFLFLREATLLLAPGSFVWRAAWAVTVATAMQTVFVGVWMWIKEPEAFGQMWPNRGIISFIAVTSAFGSIGWFSAFALQNASYVRAVGQIEVVFTLLIAWAYFRERITPLEFTGILVTVVGVLMFRLIG